MQTLLLRDQAQMQKSTKISTRKKAKVIVPFDDPSQIKEAWNFWKLYKKEEKNFKYTSPISEQAALNKLRRLSDGDPVHAKHILLQSIENGWAGFFSLQKDYIKDFKQKNDDDEFRKIRQNYGLAE